MSATGDAPDSAKAALRAIRGLRAELAAERSARRQPVAIIGMGARYPGADGLRAFWQMLREGREGVGAVPAERWDSARLHDPEGRRAGSIVNRRGGFIAGLEGFDAAFFGVSPREAPHVDPRQRLALEVTWEALEDAGIVPAETAGSATGVFMATLANDYDHLLCDDLARIEAYSGAGTANSIVANRLSYFLDWKGPSLALDTACSGSLLAVHLACESLRARECGMAVAGGVNVLLMPKANVFFSRAGALSPEGACRTFDRAADGMVRSDGAGVVVLKLLADAQRDGDRIVAVLLGGAVNHDGRSNGIMAPNGAAQEAVLRAAYERAGVSPALVQYVEAHGTATRLGDPIEVAALAAVLGAGRGAGDICRLGSLKTNVGHSEAAAGVGGLIKTALALQHGLLPPSLHFESPNPLIGLDRIPFEVQRALGPWPRPQERRIAGVSAFGFGGTNAHVVLEAAPAAPPSAPLEPGDFHLLPVSAQSAEAAGALARAFARQLEEGADPGIVCRAAARRRTHFPFRVAAAGGDAAELRAQLLAQADQPLSAGEGAGALAWVFSGQGSHWAGMGTGLLESEPVARAVLEACDGSLRRFVPWSLLEELQRPRAHSRLDETQVAQPAIFAVQAALAALWRHWGVQPRWVVGHSLGEAAAAHAAGILSLDDALAVVHHRSRLMAAAEGRGRTAAVAAAPEAVETHLRGIEGVAVAGSNSPGSCIIAGDAAAVDAAVAELERAGIAARPLAGITLAFHSPHMEPLRAPLEQALAGVRPASGTTPWISSVTGTVLAGEDCDARYWGNNLRQPFQFARAAQTLLELGCRAFLEIAPHAVLGSALQQSARAAQVSATVWASMRRDQPPRATLRTALAGLYREGARLRWERIYPGAAPHADLPHYPWQRQRHWYDQLPGGAAARAENAAAGDHPLLCGEIRVASQAGMSVWNGSWSGERPEYLRDHRVGGRVLMPGAVALDLAASLGARILGGAPAIADIEFEAALELPPSGAVEVQATLARGEGGDEFQLHAREGDGWRRHVHAHLRPAPAASTGELESTAGWRRLRVAEHYDAMRRDGLDYGPRFQTIVGLWQPPGPGNVVVAELRLPGDTDSRGYRIHPALLDGALQAVAAAGGHAAPYLPVAVQEFTLAEGAHAPRWCRAQLRGAAGAPLLEADMELYDEARRRVGRIAGLRLRRTAPQLALESSLLAEHWIEVGTLPARALANEGPWWIAGDPGGLGKLLADKLAALGIRARAADAGAVVAAGEDWHGVVYLGAIEAPPPDQEAATGRMLGAADAAIALLQARVGQTRPPGGVWMATRGALPVAGRGVEHPEQALVCGLALAAALEHPELGCRTVDLDPAATLEESAAALAGTLTCAREEERWGWRAGRAHVARLGRWAARAPAEPLALRPDATYMITGGLGALGLATAVALARHGARRLVLVGRAPADGERARDARRALEAAGARADVRSLDVGDRAAVAALCRELRGGDAPLRGVIHAAGVLDDALLARQTPAHLAKVFGPKGLGAWNLHCETQGMELDFFVGYSSAASLLGSAGQANYAAANAFLDALCHHRRERGLPALSLNWGAWEAGGMASEAAARARMAAHGVREIPPQQGLALLASLLAGPQAPAQLGVFPVDWPRFAAQFGGRVPPRLSEVAPRPDAAGAKPRFREAWGGLPPSDRPAAMQAFVGEQLAAVLGFGAAAPAPGPRQRLFDAGLDSLTALELRNRLEAGLGLSLPSTLAFDHGTIEALSEHLCRALEAPQDLDAASATEIENLLAAELGRAAEAGR